MKFNVDKDELYYISLGDSIAESLNIDYQYGISGYFDKKNKEIHGISYPAFLARLYQEAGIKIKYFENFGLSGSKTKQWLYFLSEKNYNYSQSKKFIDNVTKNYDNLNEPDKPRISRQFGDFGIINKGDFDYLKTQIKKANLITINIGANDAKELLPFSNFFNIFLSKIDIEKNIELVNLEAKKIIKQVSEKIILIINNIKDINPNCKIILVGYLKPLNRIAHVFDEIVDNQSPEIKDKLSIKLLDWLNEIMKISAKKTNIDYINFFNDDVWYKNSKIFTKNFYDIHPSLAGYKKIAQQIFLKTTLDDFYFLKANSVETVQNKIPEFNKKYFESDWGYFNNFFDFSKTNITDTQLINIAFGKNNNFILETSKFEKEYDKYLVKNNNFDYIREAIILDDLNSKVFVDKICIFFEEKGLDPQNLIRKFLAKNKVIDIFTNVIANPIFINVVIDKIQIKIDAHESQNNKINLSELKKIIIGTFLDRKNIFIFLQKFLEVLYETKDLQIIYNLRKIIIYTIANYLNNDSKSREFFMFSQNQLHEFLKRKELNSLNELSDILLEIIFNKNNKNEIIKNIVNSFFELIKEKKNFSNLNDLFYDYFIKLFDGLNLNKIIEELLEKEIAREKIIDSFVSFFNLQNIKCQDRDLINEFLYFVIKKSKKDIYFNKIFIKILTFSKKQKNDILDKNWIDFIFSIKNEELLNFINKLTSFKISNQEEDLISNFINLIFDKSPIEEGTIFNILKNINPPTIFLKKNKRISYFILMKEVINKFEIFNKIYKNLTTIIYHSFQREKKNNNILNDLENHYFKVLFRFISSTILFAFSVFQKNININIFWFGNEKSSQKIPSITGILYHSFINKDKTNTKKELGNLIFKNTEKTIDNKKIDENNYTKDHFLYYVYTSKKYPKNKFKENEEKLETILKAIKNGQW
ncbi:MAG: SGNH/GDSL hydrolase family protein [Metamycoplasmataceae bacterium]